MSEQRYLVCCLCAGEWPRNELGNHMEQCRRERVRQFRQLPPPYEASEILRPRTLLARNLLPPIPVRCSVASAASPLSESVPFQVSAHLRLPMAVPRALPVSVRDSLNRLTNGPEPLPLCRTGEHLCRLSHTSIAKPYCSTRPKPWHASSVANRSRRAPFRQLFFCPMC